MSVVKCLAQTAGPGAWVAALCVFLRQKYETYCGGWAKRKGLQDCNCPMCTLSQNGYGETLSPEHAYTCAHGGLHLHEHHGVVSAHASLGNDFATAWARSVRRGCLRARKIENEGRAQI